MEARTQRVRDYLQRPDHPDRQRTDARSDPPFVGQPRGQRCPADRDTGSIVSRSRTSSAWRCVPVLSNTCRRWVFTVVTDSDNSSAIGFKLFTPRNQQSHLVFASSQTVEAPQQRGRRFEVLLGVDYDDDGPAGLR